MRNPAIARANKFIAAQKNYLDKTTGSPAPHTRQSILQIDMQLSFLHSNSSAILSSVELTGMK